MTILSPRTPPTGGPSSSGPQAVLCDFAGCGDWGNWGFGVGKTSRGRWYCRAHKHLGEELVAALPPAGPPGNDKRAQGALF